MHFFRDNEILLQAGYDVIVISPPGRAACNVFMSDSESATITLLIAFYSKFLVTMHGFRDNEVLLQT